MTTRIDEVTPQERSDEVHPRKRGERTDVKSFTEADLASKPLVEFDAPPVPAAPPLTW
jgi:hypothetical protein